MKSVKGKNVLITGAAMGMGRLFAERAIAEQAAAVVLLDVDEDTLNDTLEELDEGSSEVSGYIVDVSDADAVADTAAAVLDEVGRIDVLVNNAGVVRGNHYFWETDLERDTKFTIDVNTLAPMYVAHAFLPEMIAASGECRMLNLASAAGAACGFACGFALVRWHAGHHRDDESLQPTLVEVLPRGTQALELA